MRPNTAPIDRSSISAKSSGAAGGTAKSRRQVLQGLGTAAAGVFLPAAPWIMRSARAETRELRVMIWSDFLPEAFRKAFEHETGLTIVHTPYGSSDELLSRLSATRGRQYDLVSPASL